ncbi:MAG TPA: tetratricopeptide repeat protein, partial [Ardenticatenaceae bacterium]|nr:tetratricopeptide repeat protein [Ardenticatenaceae bacterium]
STLAQPSTLELLQSLVDKSLLVPMEQDGEPRFHMLRTIRDYALEQLVAVGEDTLAERAHALSFAHLVEAAEPMLMSGARQPHLARLALEHDNIRAALDWSLSARGDLELGLRMGGALLWFWYFAGHLSEGRDRLERLASRGRDAGLVSATAKVLYGAGALAWVQGDYATALARLKESVGLYEQAGDRHGLAYPLTYVGMVAQFQGDHATACEPLRESVRLFREAGDEWGLALALNHQGYAARFTGDLELAASICEESLALFRQLGDDWSATLPLINYGLLAVAQCDFKAARACLSEAVALRRQLGDKWGTAWALSHLAAAFQGEGRHAQALPLYEESLGLYRDVGSRRGMASCLLGLAHASRAQRRFDRAARLLGMGEALLASVGAALPPQVSDRPALEELVATLRRRLGEQGLRDAWAAGRAAPVTDSQVWLSAAAGVDASTPPMRQPPTAAPATNDSHPAGLTAREVEVLRLLSTGMTNAQIAARLVLSTLTVNVHLRTIYGKLGVSSRTAAARFAIDRNLV